MGGIIALIVFFILLMTAAHFLDTHPGSIQLLLFSGFVWGAIVIYRRFSAGSWHRNYVRTNADAAAERIRAREAAELKARIEKETAEREAAWATYIPPTTQQFLAETALPPDSPPLTLEAHGLLARVCMNARYDRQTMMPAQAMDYYDKLKAATNQALADYTKWLPDIYKPKPTGPTPFTRSVIASEDDLKYANQSLARPFKWGFSGVLRNQREYNSIDEPTAPSPVTKRWDEENKDFNLRYREYKDELRAYEKLLKQFEQSEERIQSKLTPTEEALWESPLYDYVYLLRPQQFEIPFEIPDSSRFAGTWIVAPPGRGKTNLLHNMIANDLSKPCTLVLMDSKGDLINGYKGYSDVVIIDPHTVEINPFQLGSSTRTLDFLEYIFSALLETKLTPKQTTLFRCCLALMLKIPNATIETFRRVLVHGWKPYEQYVMSLEEDNRDFFHVDGRKSEFDSGQYNDTKQEVLQRLRLLVSNDYLKQIFTAPNSNTDFFKLLDSGKTVIIDNSKDVLGENGAEFFGRFFVAMVWMAAVSRSKQRQDDKVPVYFYIDECHTVIKRDAKITTILDECRSQKIALILAHQRIGQIEPQVMDALNNCAVRMTNSDDDAEALAKRFRVDASALRLPVGKFSCFVRDKTPAAVVIDVKEFDMSIFPPVSEEHPQPKPRAPNPPPKDAPAAVPKSDVEDF